MKNGELKIEPILHFRVAHPRTSILHFQFSILNSPHSILNYSPPKCTHPCALSSCKLPPLVFSLMPSLASVISPAM
jgi:hypothetical protein